MRSGNTDRTWQELLISVKKQSYSEARTVTENRCHTSRAYAAEDSEWGVYRGGGL